MPLPVRRREGQRQAMPVQRFDPFRDLQDAEERISQLMDSLWSGAGALAPAVGWVPPVDLEETEDAWIVEAEVPGARREDINVEVRDSELAITGEIKEREREGIIRRRTRRTGRFEYRVTLPGQVNPDQVEARLHEGVLTVRIPKPAEARPRRVDVKAEEPGAQGQAQGAQGQAQGAQGQPMGAPGQASPGG
jgi:HSP20 family protein